ncbi:MAG: type I pullulanase [Negativicutes bacterium]|jgi:pullulanase
MDLEKIAILLGILIFSVLGLGLGSAFAETPKSSSFIIHYYRFDGDYKGWGVWCWSKSPKDLPGASFEMIGTDDYGAIIKVSFNSPVARAGFLLKKDNWVMKDINEDRYVDLPKGSNEVWLIQGDKQVYSSVPKIIAAMHAWQDDANKITLKLDKPLLLTKGNNGFWLRQRGTAHYGPVEVRKVTALETNSAGLATTVELTAERNLEVNKLFFVEHDGYNAVQLFPRKVLDDKKYYYNGELGCNYASDKSQFALWAPTACAVDLRLYATADTQEYQTLPMMPGKNGQWTAVVKGDINGQYYMFAIHFRNPDITVDNDIINVVVDPYARATAPNTTRCLVYDAQKNSASVNGWSIDRYVPLKRNTDAIIYEIHTRDMSISTTSGVSDAARGKFLGLTEAGTLGPNNVYTGLDHIKELGVSHVHLLPVFDYGVGNELQKYNQYDWYDWGYDPALYNNIEGSYAIDPHGDNRQLEFKTMVTRFHQNNIGVICDVVYNHTFQTGDGQFSVFDKIVPYYYYRVDNSGGYISGSGCGNDVASEKPMVRKFIVDSCKYWVSEYHIDGLRFDLMGLHDKQTMLEVYKEVRKINPNAIIYGEGWDIPTGIPASERMTQTNVFGTGVAAFNDGIRDNLKGDVFKQTEGSFVQGLPPYLGMERLKLQIKGQSTGRNLDGSIPVATPNETINYVSAHDNACIWDKLKLTNPKDNEARIKQMDKLAAAVILTAQGVPFFAEADDFGRTKQGNENSYNNNEPNINPINWSLKTTNSDLFNYYKGLIALRKNHPAFRMDKKTQVDANLQFAKNAPDNVVVYTLKGSDVGDAWQTILVVYNGTDKVQRIRKNGPWNIVVDEKRAGTELLAQAKNVVIVQPYSALVAYKTIMDEDYASLDAYVEMNDPYYGW